MGFSPFLGHGWLYIYIYIYSIYKHSFQCLLLSSFPDWTIHRQQTSKRNVATQTKAVSEFSGAGQHPNGSWVRKKKNKHPRLKQTSGVWSSPKVVEIWDVSSPSIYNGSPLFWIKQSHTNPLGLLHTTRDSAIFTLQDIHHPRGVAARFKMDHSRVPDDGYVRYQ